jgi:1-acyl-sn-glycerol-3-phosphate acyltransferase
MLTSPAFLAEAAPAASTDTSEETPASPAAAVRALRSVGATHLRRYHRHEIAAGGRLPDEPVLFVANHGFGGIGDLNVAATFAALERVAPERAVTTLTHQLAWTLGTGKLVEAAGARPAGRAAAGEAFERGESVLVFPGGDLEASKSFADRNRIVFGVRRGFARLAADNAVPIVPIVTAGAGESLLVLSDGQRLARALRLDKTLRVKTLPVALLLPWGLGVGVTAVLPYLPLPTKLTTIVLDPMRPCNGEPAERFGDRVEAAMQAALTAMTADRIPLVG